MVEVVFVCEVEWNVVELVVDMCGIVGWIVGECGGVGVVWVEVMVCCGGVVDVCCVDVDW